MIKKDYNIGLDIGATSVGFAGIDEQYNPIKLKGKTVVGWRVPPELISNSEGTRQLGHFHKIQTAQYNNGLQRPAKSNAEGLLLLAGAPRG